MDLESIIKEVKAVRDAMSSILAPQSNGVLQEALASLEAQKRKSDGLPKRATKPPWNLTIPQARPLVFGSGADEVAVKHNLEVDLSCEITQPNERGDARGVHNIAIRVWSTDRATYFRQDYDAAHLEDVLQTQKRRVMLRFHFDRCNPGQEGPRHHLQIGGKGQATEYSWIPENWKLPRFAHMPVNFALACEFVGRTFFPKAFVKIAEEPTWRGAVMTAERTYLLPYLSSLPYVQVSDKQHTKTFFSWAWNG